MGVATMKRTMLKCWRAVLAAVVLAGLVGCESVPLTGRSQLNLVSDTEMQTQATAQYQQTLSESKLSANAEYVARVRRVGARISVATEDWVRRNSVNMQFQWEFNVIQDDAQVNAWCMPGGKIAFYTGIMPICADDAGVAIVMGHEVAHALCRHGNERMSQALLAGVGVAALGEAMRSKPAETQAMWTAAVGMGVGVGMLKFSRNQELEADRVGLVLAAMAGYDPRQAVPFWERMEQIGGSRPVEFLSTHPAEGHRVTEIQRHLPEALEYYHP
jgi:predicted Zn-dependent protease